MTDPTHLNHYFFGYGSLVNRATHDYSDIRPAQLQGWRRMWRQTGLRSVAYLTVEPDMGAEIEGLIAAVPQQSWAALDERERSYDRISVAHQVTHDLTHSPEVAVYSIPEGTHAAPDLSCPVLLSYIDVVVQGYIREFGEAGARRFFTTTSGWEVPVLDDRRAPVYPRHQVLEAREQDLVDEMLHNLGVMILQGMSDA